MSDIIIGNIESTEPMVLDSNLLTTHAAVFGTTGSGKSCLLLGMCNQLANRGIPVVLVDIKGDMANIALQKEVTNLKFHCITPGGSHGESVNILSDLRHPNRAGQAATTLLSLIGEEADSIKSKTHAFLSHAINYLHQTGRRCSLTSVIHQVHSPEFDYVGALPVDAACSKRSRTQLASKLNNLLTSPQMVSWLNGIDLDVEPFMSPEAATVTIYSVAHIVDPKAQTLAISTLLDNLLVWTKQQKGSHELRACIAIDECVGLLPPHPYNPPTKAPLMMLLKQARAFGVGCILATQNPMDVDYKALSNCNTWLIGKLSMKGDIDRIVHGLCSHVSASSPERVRSLVSSLLKRQFLITTPGGPKHFMSREVTFDPRGPLLPKEIDQMFRAGVLVRMPKPKVWKRPTAYRAKYSLRRKISIWIDNLKTLCRRVIVVGTLLAIGYLACSVHNYFSKDSSSYNSENQ